MMTVTKSYSYENFGASADMNRNNYPILPPMDELDNGRGMFFLQRRDCCLHVYGARFEYYSPYWL